jgi:predicted transcriptional regulator YheO
MFDPKHLPDVFDLLVRIAEAVVATVGPTSEVVVHDLRNPEHTVIGISGNLTRRAVGAPVPDPELLPGYVDAFQEDLIRYRTLTGSGRELLSSTVWVRDIDGHIVGALCINMDFANIRLARDLLDRAIENLPASTPDRASLATFATSVEDFVAIALRGAMREIGKEPMQLDRRDKVRLIRELNAAGVFEIRRAAEIVARELGISRATVYTYLKDARIEPGGLVMSGSNNGNAPGQSEDLAGPLPLG